MAMSSIHAALAVSRPWASIADFHAVVDEWRKSAPRLLPARADSHEPVRRVFDPELPDVGVDAWLEGVWIARRSKPDLQAGFFSGSAFTNSTAHIAVHGSRSIEYIDELGMLATRLGDHFDADMGMFHSLCESELRDAIDMRRPDIAITNSRTGRATILTGHLPGLKAGLATLYWGNVFGARYQELFGFNRLCAAPWFAIEKVGRVMVGRVTEAPPTDMTWSDYRERREAIKVALGEEAFWPGATKIPDLSLASLR